MLGAILGWTAAVYYLPSARTTGSGPAKAAAGTVVRPPAPAAPASATPVAAPHEGETTLFGRQAGAGVVAPGAFAEPRAETPRPAEPAPVAEPEPEPQRPVVATPAPPAEPEAPVDFRELCIKPAAWPPIVTLNKEINAQVMQGEEVIAEIPLAAGEKLQVSKVFGDATAEVRAKGAKFIVKAADTDLAAQARVRLAEISGRPRAPAPTPVATTPPSVEPTPAPREPAPAPTRGRGDDLDAKMRSLFGTPEKR